MASTVFGATFVTLPLSTKFARTSFSIADCGGPGAPASTGTANAEIAATIRTCTKHDVDLFLLGHKLLDPVVLARSIEPLRECLSDHCVGILARLHDRRLPSVGRRQAELKEGREPGGKASSPSLRNRSLDYLLAGFFGTFCLMT